MNGWERKQTENHRSSDWFGWGERRKEDRFMVLLRASGEGHENTAGACRPGTLNIRLLAYCLYILLLTHDTEIFNKK